MDWLKSQTTVLVVFFLAIAGLQGYGLMSVKGSMEERLIAIEESNAQADERITVMSSDIDVLVNKLGVTTQDLETAQEYAKQLKAENDRVRRALNAKADTKTVAEFQKQATTRIDAVHQETTTKIDGINGDVTVVRTDLDATRNVLNSTRTDLDVTRNDLKATRDEVANSRRDLGTLIARNSSELADLRRKGERDYVEFDLAKSKQFQRIGDVMLQLKKTDVKKQKYEVVINADDQAMQKKDRLANEPVTFLVGRERLRYELVVNKVDKDRIVGYISSPKGNVKSAELQ